MPLPLLCDEHTSYAILAGLHRQGIDAVSVQQVGLAATADSLILEYARQQGRVIYTRDADYLRLNSSGVQHLGILYHHPSKYSIGEAIDTIALACHALSMDEMRNRVEYL